MYGVQHHRMGNQARSGCQSPKLKHIATLRTSGDNFSPSKDMGMIHTPTIPRHSKGLSPIKLKTTPSLYK